MKTKILTALCAACVSSILTASEAFPLLDLSKSTKGFNCYGNLKLELAEAAGVKYLDIRVKDPNLQKYSAFQLFAVPRIPDAGKYDRLVIDLKGNGATGVLRLLLADRKNKVEWRWNGWRKNSAVPLDNTQWHKYTFLFKDMVCISKTKAPFALENVDNLQLIFGDSAEGDSNAGYQLLKIVAAGSEPENEAVPSEPSREKGQQQK